MQLYEDLSKNELSRSQPLRLIDGVLAESNLVPATSTNSFSISGARDEQFIGQFIGSRYRLDRILGSGGMSMVYLAFDVKLQRLLAVKLMHAHLNFENRYLQRFQQEGKALSKLDHPNIVKVFEYGLHAGNIPYMVMEYVEGTTLASILKEHPKLSIDFTLDMAIQVCGALGHAHKARVIHRDLKPSNIMIRADESGNEIVKIVDFGIAKIASETHSLMTGTGEVFGSPVYMSPEQCEGLATDRRTDLYSLGCVIYESLVGTPPFVGDSPLATMMKHQKERPVSLHEASLGEIFPDELERTVQKLLAKSPDSRFDNAAALSTDLANIRDHGYAAVQLPAEVDSGADLFRNLEAEPKNKGSATKETISSHLKQAHRPEVQSGFAILVYVALGSFVLILIGSIVYMLSASSHLAADTANPRNTSAENARIDSQVYEGVRAGRPKSDVVDSNSDNTNTDTRRRIREQNMWSSEISRDPRALTLTNFGTITDWQMLGLLKNLMAIDLTGTSFGPGDIAYLKDLPLRNIDFTGLKIAPGLISVADMKTLHTLNLTNTGLHDSDVLRINTRIQDLSLAGCPITDDGVKSLLRLKSLKSLNLRSTIINDDSIKYLAQMRLESLNIQQTQITRSGIDSLKKMLPGCIIYCE